MFSRKVIYGCASRGDENSPYLTRITLLQTRFGRLCLHIFHRSDAEVDHDHPWRFWTLILWRGYVEQTQKGKRRLWPGMILYRSAEWRHRVVLLWGRPAVTLVWMGNSEREWGFYTPEGWVWWRKYFHEKGC